MTSGSKVEEEYVYKFMFYSFTSWVLKCEIHTAQDMVPMKNVKRRISLEPNLTQELNACEVQRLNQLNN